MKYYLTSHIRFCVLQCRSVMDLWCDDDSVESNTHFVKHLKRLRGDLDDDPIPEVGLDVHQILPYYPPFDSIKPYIRFVSENRTEVIEYAVMEALNCSATSREAETLLQHL